MDVVGGVLLADWTQAKILSGSKDHSRFVVCAGVTVRATSRAACRAFSSGPKSMASVHF